MCKSEESAPQLPTFRLKQRQYPALVIPNTGQKVAVELEQAATKCLSVARPKC
jgi:hypothetical protein